MVRASIPQYESLAAEAAAFAVRAHQGQVRKGTKFPYVVHPIGVAHILRDLYPADESLEAAGYLHDVLEDTETTATVVPVPRGHPQVGRLARQCRPDSGPARWICDRRLARRAGQPRGDDAVTSDNGPLTGPEMDALALLAGNRRLFVVLVPDDASDEFVARLTAWSNFCLDTRLLPPLWLPTTARGDGLVCPFCGMPSTRTLEGHAPDCEWIKAAARWGGAQLQIDAEFGGPPQ